MTRKILFGSALAALGVGAALKRGKREAMDLRGKVVLITGGSRGLGLALAREFGARGSRLILCARNVLELESAKQDLVRYDVLTTPCDVTDRQRVGHMVEEVLARYGRIDVLVNNAGVIQVGPLESMTLDDFQKTMDVMFWGSVHTALAVLRHMRERGQGRIVNITSIGGKVSIPHLVPYSCAKSAAVAFSEGLRAELQGTGVKVITIAPGLMRTGSYGNAQFKGESGDEAAWFSLSASLPGLSMDADCAARQIVRATIAGRAERILGIPANVLSLFHGVFPGLATDLLGMVNGALPRAVHAERGAGSRILHTIWMRAATALGRKDAERYLQPGRAA